MHRPINIGAKTAALLLLFLLGACGPILGMYHGPTTRDVAPEKANYMIKPDQALIIFVRPKNIPMDGAVFDITEGSPTFVASIPGATKLAYYAKPGKRQYMIVNLNNADFMTTNLEKGKVYYVLVTWSIGGRLWFRPFTVKDPSTNPMVPLNEPRFADWYNVSQWAENLPKAESMVRTYMSIVLKNMAEWRPKWQNRPNKAVLNPEDGQTSLYRGAPAN